MDTNVTGELIVSMYGEDTVRLEGRMSFRSCEGRGDTTISGPIGAMNQLDPEDDDSVFLRNVGIHLQE
jgi:hypothetical protein